MQTSIGFHSNVDRGPAQKQEAVRLFKALCAEYGRKAVLSVIEEQTQIAPKVVEEWLYALRLLSSGLRRQLLGCLRNEAEFAHLPRPPLVFTIRRPPAAAVGAKTSPAKVRARRGSKKRAPAGAAEGANGEGVKEMIARLKKGGLIDKVFWPD